MKRIDLTTLSREQLKIMLANARRQQANDLEIRVVQELALRGFAEGRDFDVFEWNQTKVRETLAPFREIAEQVPGNRRTAYTEAGGRRIGKSKADPEWMWIDSYSAIKSRNTNAVFVCYVPRPGDHAYFQLHVDGTPQRQFSTDEITDALSIWSGIATAAATQGPFKL